MVVLAVIAILAISLQEARRLRVDQDHLYNLAIFAIIGGIIFSRVIHVVDRWDYYMQHPEQIFSFEGVGVYGAVIGVLLAIVVYCLVRKLSIWLVADMVSPGALVGMAIGRIGCILNGCCYGLESDAACSVIYTNPATYAPLDIAVLPTQFFHLFWNLAAFAVLWALRRKIKPTGNLFLLYMALYAAGDLLIRFFREGTPWLFGIQQAQLIGIIILVVTVPWFIVRMWLDRKGAKAQAASSGSDSGGEVDQAKP
jgi:phosphatidylglycerol:prolipoprotein diacylglycerol transferase